MLASYMKFTRKVSRSLGVSTVGIRKFKDLTQGIQKLASIGACKLEPTWFKCGVSELLATAGGPWQGWRTVAGLEDRGTVGTVAAAATI